MYSAFAIANSFLEKAQERKMKDMTPMKLQKIMFFAQSHYLKLNSIKTIEDLKLIPLFDDFFARWKYGPVIPSLYHEFKELEGNPINTCAQIASGKIPKVSPQDHAVLHFMDELLNAYGQYTGPELSTLSHDKSTAWKQGDGSVITNEELYHQTFFVEESNDAN